MLLWLVLSPLLLWAQPTISNSNVSMYIPTNSARAGITLPNLSNVGSSSQYNIIAYSPDNTLGQLYVDNSTTPLGSVAAAGNDYTGNASVAVTPSPQLYFTSLNKTGTITFNFVASDLNGGGKRQYSKNSATFTVIITNPATSNNVRAAIMPSNAGATSISSLSATIAGNNTISSYTIKTVPSGGSLYLSAAPTTALAAGNTLTPAQISQLQFDPNGARFGDLSFTYTATNNDGLESNTATYTIPVANVPPVAVNDVTVPVTRNQSASISVVANDTDTDKDAGGLGGILNSTVDLDPDQTGIQQTRILANKGTFTVNSSGVITFVPVNNYAGISTITYTVQDAQGLTSNQATIRVEVKNVTTAYDDSNEVEKNTTVSGNVILNDIDPQNTGFTVTRLINVTKGTLVLNANGSYTYTPNTGFLGTDSFTYRACDKTGTPQCSEATVYLNVYDPAVQCISATGPNQLVNSSFTDGNIGFNTNYEYKANVAGNQELVPETTYAIGADASEYHPNFFGTGHGIGPASVVGNNFMMVNATSAIRTLYTQTFKVQPNRYYTFSAFFNNLLNSGGVDPEVGFVINGESTSGTITVATTPNEWVKYSDVWYSGNNTTATFEIRNLTLAAGGNDIGIDDLYFGTCNAVPVANNTLTTAIPSNTTSAAAIVKMDATDSDGTIDFYTIKSLPAFGTLYVNGVVAVVDKPYTPAENDKLTYLPAAGKNGNFTFTFLATDNSTSVSNIATYTIPVGNTAPIAKNVTTAPAVPNIAAATAINPMDATDGDGTIAKYVIVTVPNPAHGTLYVGGTRVTAGPFEVLPALLGQLTFDPTGSYAGNATFTYYAFDNDGNQSNTAIYTVPISNELPVAQNKTYNGMRNTASTTPLSALTATDADGFIASFTIASLPASGSLTLNGVLVSKDQTIQPDQASELSYTPAKSTTGNFSFTYYATDNLGGVSNIATYSIPVSGPLPVELAAFEVKAVGNSAQLIWNTATELRNDRFEVERSFTGQAFAAVGTVKGHGTTNTGAAYRFTDANVRAQAASGTVYYRLKQVDTDGKVTYSSVRTVGFSKQAAAISVAPNPATTEATLDLTTLPLGQYQVAIFDATGRIMYKAGHAGGEQVGLAMSTWPTGMYLVVVQGANGKFTQRLIKN